MFDLDGTIWDPIELSLEAWKRTSRSFGIDASPVTPARVGRLMGKTEWEFVTGLFGNLDASLLEQLSRTAMELEVELITQGYGTPYPGADEVLGALSRRYDMYLVSNCQRGYIEAFLQAHGFAEYFRGHTCSGDTGRPKEENLASLISDHGLERPVYIGDTETDHRAAVSAGIPFIYAAYGFGSPAGKPQYEIRDIRELITLF